MITNAKKELPSLLVVDDERTTREALCRFLRGRFNVTPAEDGTVAINLLKSGNYSIVLTDLRMPGADGMQVLSCAVNLPEPPVVLVFSAYGGVAEAVDAVKAGAFDFVVKPVKLDELEVKLDLACNAGRLRAENRHLKEQLDGKKAGNGKILEAAPEAGGVVGTSPAMEGIFSAIDRIAPSRATVLISGESGTGKEVAARMIHQKSGRKGKFIAVHCSALSENLLESELFGHEKGAFTGAVETRKGRFELAEDGTLFLDEIGEISPATQIKLLRVLEAKVFERVGGMEEIRSNARIVAATNKDLGKMAAEGTFREDLFYRLNVINLKMPPLRERPGDIMPLAEAFLHEYCSENGKNIKGFTPEAAALLVSYPWPGNVRELRNAVERMVVFAGKEELDVTDLPENICGIKNGDESRGDNTVPAGLALEDNEKILIQRALAECGNNRTKAAEKLGISRRTLHRKLKEYSL